MTREPGRPSGGSLDWPPKRQLIEWLQTMNASEVARKLGVSPSSVVYHCQQELIDLAALRAHRKAAKRKRTRTFEEKFWDRVWGPRGASYPNLPPDTCWLWRGGANDGYGVLQRNKKPLLAHRVAFELTGGELLADHVLHHTCNNTACVNPQHLEQILPSDHVLLGTSPSAICARKTHCGKGHPLSGENLAISGGKRICVQCRRAKQARYREKLRKQIAKARGQDKAKRVSIPRPPKAELRKALATSPLTQVGVKYGVHAATVHRWCREYGLKM